MWVKYGNWQFANLAMQTKITAKVDVVRDCQSFDRVKKTVLKWRSKKLCGETKFRKKTSCCSFRLWLIVPRLQ